MRHLALAVAALVAQFLVVTAKIGATHDMRLLQLSRSGAIVRDFGTFPIGHVGAGALWSPDGSKLAWVSDDGVQVANADGSNPISLASRSRNCSGSCTGFGILWSPNGGSLLISGTGRQTDGFDVVDAAGGGVSTPVVTPSNGVFYAPIAWPKAGTIVYERDDTTLSHPSLDIRTSTPRGGNVRVIYRFANPRYEGSAPAFAPDRRSFAFIIDQTIDFVSAATGKITRSLAWPRDLANTLSWSPTGKRLAIVERLKGRWVVQTIDTAGKHAKTIGTGFTVNWLSDGELLIYRGANQTQVWESVHEKPAKLLFDVPLGLSLYDLDAR